MQTPSDRQFWFAAEPRLQLEILGHPRLSIIVFTGYFLYENLSSTQFSDNSLLGWRRGMRKPRANERYVCLICAFTSGDMASAVTYEENQISFCLIASVCLDSGL